MTEITDKKYTLPTEIFAQGYDIFRKEHTPLRRKIAPLLFLTAAVIFIILAVTAPDRTVFHVLAFAALAFAFMEWYNAKRLRRVLVDAHREQEDTVYTLSADSEKVVIATVPQEEGEEIAPTVIPVDGNFRICEYDRVFLVLSGTGIFYIVPKEVFTAEELEFMKNLERPDGGTL